MSVQRVGKKYRARGYLYGQQVHLGMYSTKELAEQAVKTFYEQFEERNLWDSFKRIMRQWLKK